MQECSICRLGKVTWSRSEEKVSALVSEVSNMREVRCQPIKLPSIVPIVSLRRPASFCWDAIDTDAIIVEFGELLDRELLIGVSKAGGIHNYLGFDGSVFLSSVMPDELLTRRGIFYYFMRLIDWLGFDAAIAWDSPVYADIPLYDAWVNLLKGLALTHSLAQKGIPVIGLVKGNADRQIRFSVETLARIGIRSMALHASEHLVGFRKEGAARQILYSYFAQMSKWSDSVLVIGALRPSSLSFLMGAFLEHSKLSVAGLSWFLDAGRGSLYSDRGNIDATSNFVECRCTPCSIASPRELMADLKTKAKHNLNHVATLYSGAKPSSMRTYDLMLGTGESAHFVSDIHLGSGSSLLDNLVDFLREEKPSYIVFLGDTFDLGGGSSPNVAEVVAFFNALREVGAPVLVTKGCRDCEQEALLSTLDGLTTGGKPKPMLWASPDDKHRGQLWLDLYTFYRSAKERLNIRLANGELAIAEHGHKIVADPSTPTDDAIAEMNEARKLAGARLLVMGHLHRALIAKDGRVASTGCWTLGSKNEVTTTKRGDVGTSVVIDGDGTMEIRRRS